MNIQEIHEKYMRRCLELATRGRGYVAPNPMVGAVLVCDDKIIGEGYHQKYGEAHAEPNAIAAVKDSSLMNKSTLYVNLEPCSHFGKTPPCAQLIIDQKISRVIVGGKDPYPEVSGRGIQMMRDAGVEVLTDVLKKECEELNKRFLTFNIRKRPYVILKWAQSADGFLDNLRIPGDGKEAVHFSSAYTRMLLHKRRSEEAAIMVGTRTALLDNPSLTVRYWQGKNPLRIVIDKDLRIPPDFHLFDNQPHTWIFTAKEKENTSYNHYYILDFEEEILPQIMDMLYQQKIQSLIVEGGAVLLESFLSAGLWDEIIVETVPMCLQTGVKAPVLPFCPDGVYKCEKSKISSYTNRNLPKIL